MADRAATFLVLTLIAVTMMVLFGRALDHELAEQKRQLDCLIVTFEDGSSRFRDPDDPLDYQEGC